MTTRRRTGTLWSRYNVLYESPRFGPFLYNAVSNAMLDLDDEHYRRLAEMRDRGGAEAPPAAPEGQAPSVEADFFSVLCEHRMLVDEGADDTALLALRYDRLSRGFDTSTLSLTICPTLGCDFRCVYCFEDSQADATVMSPDTIAALMAFIRTFKDARRLKITWYGGEPTLAWHVIEDITRQVGELDIELEGASLVTNGYGLDEARIARLDDLKIKDVQITLDGPADIHDVRRPLAGGGATFARIIGNVRALEASTYGGWCRVRVNVDDDNVVRVAEVWPFLAEAGEGGRMSAYPARVESDGPEVMGPLLGNREWAAVETGLQRSGAWPCAGGSYPSAQDGICTATGATSFVIGPEGELYKCWESVGKAAWSIGHISSRSHTPAALSADYALALDPFVDDSCGRCVVLPVCGGGCVHKRLLARRAGRPLCSSPFKDHLAEYLDEYYDAWLARALCAVGLPLDEQSRRRRGYRPVHPAAVARAPEPSQT